MNTSTIAIDHSEQEQSARDYACISVGRSIWSGVEDGRSFTSVVFAPTAFAHDVELLYRKGILRSAAPHTALRCNIAGAEVLTASLPDLSYRERVGMRGIRRSCESRDEGHPDASL